MAQGAVPRPRRGRLSPPHFPTWGAGSLARAPLQSPCAAGLFGSSSVELDSTLPSTLRYTPLIPFWYARRRLRDDGPPSRRTHAAPAGRTPRPPPGDDRTLGTG